MTTSKALLTTHCFVRATRPDKVGKHAVACVALASTGDPATVKVAWSVCNKNDNFVKAFGVKRATCRLNSRTQSHVVERNATDIITKSGLAATLTRFRDRDEQFTIESAIQGALADLAV